MLNEIAVDQPAPEVLDEVHKNRTAIVPRRIDVHDRVGLHIDETGRA